VLSAASLGFVSVLEGASSAELEARDLEGHSTLALAASYGHPSCISLLLGKRVDVEARDQGGSTVLMAACEGGHASVVALLLSSLSGAHGTVGLTRALQAQNDDGVTALHLAAAHGHLEVVQQLLQAASSTADALSTALVNQCDRWQRTALLLSISRARSLDVAIELLAVDGCEVDAPDCFGCTPLGVAAAAGVTELVGALLFARADPNRPDRAGETPLMVAAKAGKDWVVTTLLALPGLHVEALNCDGQSALMLATNEAHEGVAAMLVRRGRRAPNSPEDSTGSSPGSELWI
jgi:ankyrin repeat protein